MAFLADAESWIPASACLSHTQVFTVHRSAG
jgi:hypothetical protein